MSSSIHASSIPDVSIILPVHNAEKWLDQCFESVLQQCFAGSLELCVYNDASSDASAEVIEKWKPVLTKAGVCVRRADNDSTTPRGVGFAKNRAIALSSGQFLCFLDADDCMESHRVEAQYAAALQQPPHSIIGCKIRREPADSTERYTRWCNNTSQHQLKTQAYTSHGPTILMPTWFCSRETFDKVGRFNEGGKGVPEDLIFFYQHLKQGGSVYRVDQVLLTYRYHPQAASFSVLRETIWDLRIAAIQEMVISQWSKFTVWNAGKEGRRFYRSLNPVNKQKVIAFCDVDVKKIQKGVYIYEESTEVVKPRIPIIHFRESSPPLIICVKLDLTGGGLESNLESLKLTEGLDYYHFS